MEELAPIVLALLAFLGAGAFAFARFVMKKPPARSAPKGTAAASEAEAAEREKIDIVIGGAVADVMDIDKAPDRERTRRAGSRLRE